MKDIGSLESALIADRVSEKTYSLEHPDVIKWTKFFYQRAEIPQMFRGIWQLNKKKNKFNALVVGAFWQHFSNWVPLFLGMAMVRASNNIKRHYLVQIVFEELGGRNTDEIHPFLFESSIKSVGIDHQRVEEFHKDASFKLSEVLAKHLANMENAKDDFEIFGLNLGLEINAEENISTLLDSLWIASDSKKKLEESLFFQIHNVVEEEHIRLNVANFLRFCETEDAKSSFLAGFDKSVEFWKSFWDGVCTEIKRLS